MATAPKRRVLTIDFEAYCSYERNWALDSIRRALESKRGVDGFDFTLTPMSFTRFRAGNVEQLLGDADCVLLFCDSYIDQDDQAEDGRVHSRRFFHKPEMVPIAAHFRSFVHAGGTLVALAAEGGSASAVSEVFGKPWKMTGYGAETWVRSIYSPSMFDKQDEEFYVKLISYGGVMPHEAIYSKKEVEWDDDGEERPKKPTLQRTPLEHGVALACSRIGLGRFAMLGWVNQELVMLVVVLIESARTPSPSNACVVCERPSLSGCPCLGPRYCGVDHQRYDWLVRHKATCTWKKPAT